MSANAIKTLRRELTRAKGVEEGTIVRFDRTLPESFAENRQIPVTITYASIFVGGKWYFTGRGNLASQALSSREFFDRMAEPDVSNVQVATEFEAI